MSEWDCKHGRSDDAMTPCPICEAMREIAEAAKRARDEAHEDKIDYVVRVNELAAENARLRAEKHIDLMSCCECGGLFPVSYIVSMTADPDSPLVCRSCDEAARLRECARRVDIAYNLAVTNRPAFRGPGREKLKLAIQELRALLAVKED